MDFLTTLSLIVIVCYMLYAYIHKRFSYFKDLDIPHLPPHFPFGNMGNLLARRKHFIDSMQDVYNCSPDSQYVGLYENLKPIIMLRDLDLIKSVTIKNFDYFPDHRKTFDEVSDPLVGTNLFSLSGDRWRETRNLLTPAFTASKMKGMFELMAKCAENFASYVTELVAKEPKNEVATKDLFTKYTSDVIATCAFGISVDSLKNPDNEFYRLGRQATRFDGINALKVMIIWLAPKLATFLGVKFVSDSVGSFFKNLIAKTVATRDAQGIRRPDMLQLMMDARGKTSENLKLDITEMTAQAFIFFLGGFETSATQMCIIAHELAINPDIQAKLQAEIDDLVSCSSDGPTYDAINAMPYLDAVFNESVRRHTQNAILDRICEKPFELPPALPGGKPFIVQPGMNVYIPATGIHRDSKYYEKPDQFDPDRFLYTKIAASSMNHTTSLGFGIGPRSCIGNRFAILETKILFFHLLSKFTLKPTAKTCDPFVYDPKSIVLVPKGGYWVSFESRK